MNKFLGDRIRALREDGDMTQNKLAELLVIAHNTVSQYENNERTPDPITIKKIATIFNVSTDYLLLFTDKPYNPTTEVFNAVIDVLLELKPEDEEQFIQTIKAFRRG